MFVRRTVPALLAAGLAVAVAVGPAVTLAGAGPTTGSGSSPTGVAAAAAPTGGGSSGSQGLQAKHSLRAPVTDENFYFVMADRFANGDTANDTGGSPAGRWITGSTPPTRASTRAAT